MKISTHPYENQVVHAAFLDALSGEFIARTGCGAYVHLNPVEVHRLFNDYQRCNAPVREYVKQTVRRFLTS